MRKAAAFYCPLTVAFPAAAWYDGLMIPKFSKWRICSMMNKIQMPGTNLSVSPLCLGTANFGAKLNQEDAERYLDYFFSQGGNFVDTAHVYGDWVPGQRSLSEKMLGKALKTLRPKDVVISTKGAHYKVSAPDVSRVTPREILIDLDESLEFLQVDCIDLYFLHRDNPAVPVSEIVDCLDEQVKKGKVRYLGCSNWRVPRIRAALEYAEKTGKAAFAVNQLMWSMAKINQAVLPPDYAAIDEETIAFTREKGMGIMCFTSQAQGYFTKRWQGAPLKTGVKKTYDNPENDRIFEQEIKNLKTSADVTRHCLRYFSDQPVTAVPIVSCSSMEQLAECCGAFAD